MSGAKSPATLQTSEVKQCCASLYESDRARGLKPLTGRSRHNLPNPIVNPPNPYVPTNSPAIGDLFDMFSFGQAQNERDRN
jgi:hypothetical protein